MKIENGVERIAWRFTKGELKSLLTLLGRTELPGTAIRAGMPDTETLEALTEAGIVLYCGERVLVDRAPARVLDEAAGSCSTAGKRSACFSGILAAPWRSWNRSETWTPPRRSLCGSRLSWGRYRAAPSPCMGRRKVARATRRR